ncbi:hypothetical protein C4869_23775, partial [Salmonella enterica subsp. enterica serovar Anatum]|uniref:YnfC family lipoprotein n=1 Tax=Salmonella enterica TaxID=28901 RepID=UPI000D61F574
MKKPLLLTFSCMILAGVDNRKSPEPFIPEMASFFDEFAFNPSRARKMISQKH